jgi:DNA-binding XRE family transcriptional regulator
MSQEFENIGREHAEETDFHLASLEKVAEVKTTEETNVDIARRMEDFSHEDKKALRLIANDAMGGNKNAQEVLQRLFPGVPMKLSTYWEISKEVYKTMTSGERNADYNVCIRKLNAVQPGSGVSQAPSVSARRLELGLTQKQLAEKSGINIRQIQKIESGEVSIRNITLANAIALAKALDVPTEYIGGVAERASDASK